MYGRRGFTQNVLTGFGPNGDDDQFGGPETDAAHLTGVILRLNPDGSTPRDNPFFKVGRRISKNIDPAFGEAVKYDMAIQTIDPDPVYGPEDAKPGDHGEKGAAAVKRYRTDAVKDVEQIETGGSSGGGGPQ